MAQRHRRLGLTANPLGYRLLQTINPPPNPSSQPPRQRSPEVNDPPMSSSDEAVATSLGSTISSDLSDLDSPRAKKKRKTGREVRVPKPYLNKWVSSDEKSDNPRNGDTAPSNIKATTFTSRVGSGRHNGCNGVSKRSEIEFGSKEESPFASFESAQLSQSKLKRTYRSSNIHVSAPSPKKAKAKKAGTIPMRQGDNGFKFPDTKAVIAELNNCSTRRNAAATSRKPKEICGVPSPPSKGSRRSSRNQRKQDGPTDGSQTPSTVPPQLGRSKDQEDCSGFINPLKLQSPLGSPRSTAVFRVPFEDVSPSFSLSELSNATKYNLTSLVQALEPSSSLTTTSLMSMSNDAASSSSSLSSPPSSLILDAFSESFPIVNPTVPDCRPPTPKAHCPICKAVVASSLLSSFMEEHSYTVHNNRLNMREQELFCRSHRVQTALSECESRGYPNIDWINLTARLERYNSIIEDLLKGRRESYYRNVLEGKVKSGKVRTIMQELNTLSEEAGSNTGYYGSKGAKIMMDYLSTTFSRPLRRLAKTDKLVVSSGGIPAYIQAVLVPELAVALVKEDMGIDEEGARGVMRDSAELGELINEEEEEVLEREDSGDEGEGEGDY